MANQIQGTVYQIDGNPLSSPIQVSFLTSNIYIREYQIGLIPAVNAAIVYYPNTNNQLQEQTFLVSESASTLIAAANTNGTTQVSTTVLEINQEPQIPGGLNFSFPAQGISIWPVSVPVVNGVNSFLEFKNKKYYLLEDEATLVAAANAGGGGGGGTSTGINGLNGTTNIGLGGTLLNDTTIDGVGGGYSILFEGINLFKADTVNFELWHGGIFKMFSASDPLIILGYHDISNLVSIGLKIDLGGEIKTQLQGVDNGLKLDFQNNLFSFGEFAITGYSLSFDIDLAIATLVCPTVYIINGSGSGFLALGNTSNIGDVDGTGNQTTFGVDDSISSLIGTTNLLATIGTPTTDRIKININGTDYLIVLETA